MPFRPILLVSVLLSFVFSGASQSCPNYTFSNNRIYTNCIDLPVLNSFLHWNYDSANRTVTLAYRRPNIGSSRWIAWAINPTTRGMVGSQALVAFQINGSMSAYTSPVNGYDTTLQPGALSFPVPAISAEYSSRSSNSSNSNNNEMTIFATLVLPAGSTTVNQLWQEGLLTAEIFPGQHSVTGDNIQSSGTIDFLTGQSVLTGGIGRKEGMSTGLKTGFGALVGIGGLLLVAFSVYVGFNYSSLSLFHRWNKNKSPINVEVFLERYGCLALQRYKYSDIKKMTNSFRDILGQGGYGRVFKGKLPDGRLVAVKVLNESKGDGEDFINEVATIGKTNHVNVVNLVGFCIKGFRRALVYEFMPNGSLERFIYTQKESPSTFPLGWEKLYQISLGIARGLEYLHRGCNTRILHFDIKPHNILLDENFCPKISDFGLAKLYATRESIVSTVGARGTMGYIAPELCFRSFGNVSHKSDVYSYGMMMLEMIGGRKNIDVTMDNMSEIYFPQWIYNHLKRNIEVEGLEEIHAREFFDDEKAKRMIMVALWCIQAHPIDRPSMSRVLEMLEGNNQELQIPPNPSVDPRSSSSTSL